MLTLEPFDPPSAHLHVLDPDPAIKEHENVLYMPVGAAGLDGDPSWGVYDRTGRLLLSGAYRRGPDRALVGQSRVLAALPTDADPAPAGHYVYAGPLILQYGHFLLATLARLWPYAAAPAPGTRFLWHAAHDLSALDAHPFAIQMLDALGFAPSQFTRFTRPTRIKRLTVIAPAFEENHFAYQAFQRLCRTIGSRLAPATDNRPRPPAYLARTQMTWGVKGIANEGPICGALAALGVEIIHPARLGLADQVALFGSDRVILGLTGSAFHTAIFAPPRSRLIGIELYSSDNQLLINRLAGARMQFLRPRTPVEEVFGGSAFSVVVGFPDPVGIARDLLRAAQAFA